jgi:hypothetical protein
MMENQKRKKRRKGKQPKNVGKFILVSRYEINQQFFSKQCENYKLYNRLVNNYFIF